VFKVTFEAQPIDMTKNRFFYLINLLKKDDRCFRIVF